MDIELQKDEIIEKIKNSNNEKFIDALYEVLINEDYDYVENLFADPDDFNIYFAEKYKDIEEW